MKIRRPTEATFLRKQILILKFKVKFKYCCVNTDTFGFLNIILDVMIRGRKEFWSKHIFAYWHAFIFQGSNFKLCAVFYIAWTWPIRSYNIQTCLPLKRHCSVSIRTCHRTLEIISNQVHVTKLFGYYDITFVKSNYFDIPLNSARDGKVYFSNMIHSKINLI